MTTSEEKASIYDAIGRAQSVHVAVERFYERVLVNPELIGHFAHTDTGRLKTHRRSFIAAAIGGSQGRRG
jgi:hemoglobin